MPPDPEGSWTVGRLLVATKDYLKKKGSESANLDAEVLLASVLDCRRVELYVRYDQDVGETPRAKLRELVKRRGDGAPVAYLVGKKEFYSLNFAVSPAVLIPRPDSEFVVVAALDRLKGVLGPKVVDVGTGSGCLALAIAHQQKSAHLTAIDISPEALAVARRNAKDLGLAGRVDFIEGDLLELLDGQGPFDLIVSNPPYIATAVIPTLDRGVADHEPHLALDGGPDGLRVVARLIEQAWPLLKVGGDLILEIGSDQEALVRNLVEAQPAYRLAPTVRDASNHPRVIRATRKGGDGAE